MTGSPTDLLSLAALLFLAIYAIFEVILNSWSFPTLGVIASALILVGRYRPTGSASALAGSGAMFILGMILFIEALDYLLYDLRTSQIVFSHIEQLIPQVAHYVAGAIAGLGAYRLMR